MISLYKSLIMENNSYKASDIYVLKGLEGVRKRPSMYIGDTGQNGLHHLVWEVIDNSIDESMGGHCDTISIVLHDDNSIEIVDNGRGIPVEKHPTEEKSALEVVMTMLHSGGKFNNNTYKVSGGLHGVGVSCVNALSSFFKVTIYRNKKIYTQTYSKGIPTSDIIVEGDTRKHGTKIHFIPDLEIFKENNVSYNIIANRLRELSFLNSNISLTLEKRKE